MEPGTEAIEDDEIVYRRVPVDHWAGPDGEPAPQAFLPHRTADEDGLSFERAKYSTPEQVAARKPHRPSYVVALRVRDLRRAGLQVDPDPDPEHDNPGHCLMRRLRSELRRDSETRNIAETLAHELSQLVFVYHPPPGTGEHR